MNPVIDPLEKHKMDLLRRVLSRERVRFLQEEHKQPALRRLVEILSTSPCIGDRAELAKAIFDREALMSTGIGLGLAVPHVRLASVSDLTVTVGISARGIADYASLDDKPVHLVFMIAAPAGEHAGYLRLLSVISSRAKALNERLLQCSDAAAFYQVLTGTGNGPDGPRVRGA